MGSAKGAASPRLAEVASVAMAISQASSRASEFGILLYVADARRNRDRFPISMAGEEAQPCKGRLPGAGPTAPEGGGSADHLRSAPEPGDPAQIGR